MVGDLLDERFYADLERDQAERATMSMLVPPQMLNTMAPFVEPRGAGSLTEAVKRARAVGNLVERVRALADLRHGIRALRALDRRVSRDPLDDLAELLDHRQVDDVHRLSGRVPDDGGDAVRVDVDLEVRIGHGLTP